MNNNPSFGLFIDAITTRAEPTYSVYTGDRKQMTGVPASMLWVAEQEAKNFCNPDEQVTSKEEV